MIALVVAPACVICRTPLEHPGAGPVCQACWALLRPFAAPLCEVCGEPVNRFSRPDDGSAMLCARCRLAPPPAIAMARAVGDYDGVLRSIVHALKYGQHRSLAMPLATLMAVHGSRALAGADAVVPVPLHWSRRWRRGFNQAALLARHLRLPVWNALRRTRRTESQVVLPAAARRRNVRGAFALARSAPWRDGWESRLAGRRIVLVDDVTTTGATLESCAAVLEAAGAREVRALTAARVVGSRPR